MDRRESTASQETFISLQQIDPSPIESPEYDVDKQLPDLPTPQPPPRSSTLGLSGSGHSSVYYCTFVRTCIEKRSDNDSNTPTKILNLRVRGIHHSPPHKHIVDPPPHTLRPSLRTLPPPHTPILSIVPLRTLPHNASNRNSHPLWPGPTNQQAQRESKPLRRFHPSHLLAP